MTGETAMNVKEESRETNGPTPENQTNRNENTRRGGGGGNFSGRGGGKFNGRKMDIKVLLLV